MNKQEFLLLLRKGMQDMPQIDAEERIVFYSEIIDDRIEEGLTEEEAIEAIGSATEILAQIANEKQNSKENNNVNREKSHLSVLGIILLILGSPIWLSLVIAAFAVIISVYVSVWSIIISLWAVFGAFVGCAIGAIAAGIIFICNRIFISGTALIAAGITCTGLSILFFIGCKAFTTCVLKLTKRIIVHVKNRIVKEK